MALSQQARDHLDQHLSFPSTGEELKKECDNMSDVSPEDKEEFDRMIDNEKMYNSLDEVKKDLGMGMEWN